jgi:hypothetical protein
VPVGSDEDVLGLEIAIDDARCVKTFDSFNDFRGVETGAVTAQAAPPRQLRGEITSRMKVLCEI